MGSISVNSPPFLALLMNSSACLYIYVYLCNYAVKKNVCMWRDVKLYSKFPFLYLNSKKHSIVYTEKCMSLSGQELVKSALKLGQLVMSAN